MSPWLVLIPVGVFGGFMVFVWHGLAVAPRWEARWVPSAVGVVLLVLTALVFAGFDAWGGQWTPAQMRPWVWLGQVFLASCLYLFLGLVPVWMVCVVIWLVRWRRGHGGEGRRKLNRVASPVVVAGAVLATAYGVVEAAHPAVARVEVASPELPVEFDGTRVALITDLHAGAVRSADFTREVVALVNAERPDLVVVAGDLVDGTAARYDAEIAPLTDLEAPLGVYATTGSHEMFQDTANWVRAFESVGLRVLRNESTPLERGGATIRLAGVEDATGTGDFAPDYDAALADAAVEGFTLLAAHQPAQALEVEGRGVDLQVSGCP